MAVSDGHPSTGKVNLQALLKFLPEVHRDIASRAKCFYDFDLQPLTLKAFLATTAYMLNICAKILVTLTLSVYLQTMHLFSIHM